MVISRFILIKFIFVLTILLLPANRLVAQDYWIKSLKVYGNDRQSLPVAFKNGNSTSSITIEFDLDAERTPDWAIAFRLCDEDWTPLDNVFFSNAGRNTDYQLNMQLLPTSITGAKYRFRRSYPNRDVTFPWAGKWRFYIVDAFDTTDVWAEGKFYVVKQDVEMRASLRKNRYEGRISSNNLFDRVFNLSVNIDLPDTTDKYNQMYLKGIEVVENHKVEYPMFIGRDDYDDYRYYEWNGQDDFTFFAKDIFPGNEYRRLDLRDESKHQLPETEAQFEGVEISRLYEFGKRDMNGGSRLNNPDDDDSDYFDVNFTYRPEPGLRGDVFLVGSFTDWQVYPDYKLIEDEETGLLKTWAHLKRGVYDYQYVTGTVDGYGVTDIDWLELEGNFWETSNDYHIFLFYRNQQYGGYDEIIGYVKINSGEL